MADQQRTITGYAQHEQHGNYVVEWDADRAPYCIRMVGDTNHISTHNGKPDAIRALKRYQAADKRRAS